MLVKEAGLLGRATDPCGIIILVLVQQGGQSRGSNRVFFFASVVVTWCPCRADSNRAARGLGGGEGGCRRFRVRQELKWRVTSSQADVSWKNWKIYDAFFVVVFTALAI